MSYRGRFAPTPSGPLHLGSLVAALGSYLDAKLHQGEWLLRIEDVDPPRVVAGAADAILHTLERYGFEWDGEVCWQSRRQDAYQAALDRLLEAGRVYGCSCTRKVLLQQAQRGVEGPVYPGTCRGRKITTGCAWRFQVTAQRVEFNDVVLGRVACQLDTECGDFPLRRSDGVYTYQLAVVVDDAEQGVTHVVRGADLLVSTPRQIALYKALGYPLPVYMHLPVLLDEAGQKLSKQTLATPLSDTRPLPALRQAASFLGLEVPAVDSVHEFWAQAIPAWHPTRIRPVRGKKLG
jgi:glutamyl-Q tRNA(Asp) synthetase